MLKDLVQDVRYAVRSFAKSPTFTLVAVVTLALGIGVNTAIFTVVDATLLRPLPYAAPERLFQVRETRVKQDVFSHMELSYPDFLDYQKRGDVFEALAGYNANEVPLAGSEGSEMVPSMSTSGTFFPLLGIRPALGRLYGPEDDREGAEPVVVLSHGAWQRRYGADPALPGRTVLLNGTVHTVIGVLPASFQFAPAPPADFWVPLRPRLPAPLLERRNLHWVDVVGRLKPGISQEVAQAKLAGIAEALAAEYPASNSGVGISLSGLRDAIVGPVRPLLLMLLGAVALVLLIACGNVANLLLARSAARQKELSIRLALGASRGRLVRQLLTESMLLSLVGGATGLLCAQWGLELLLAAIPAEQLGAMPYLKELPLDGRILLFTFAVSLLTGVLFGLAPALVSTRTDLQGAMKGQVQGGGGRAHGTLRHSLVVSEVALTLVLLVGAGLLFKSLVRMMDVDPGFDRANLLTQYVVLPEKYGDDDQMAAVHERILERVKTLPGVKDVGFINKLPLSGGGNTIRYLVAGRPPPAPGQEYEANIREITGGYFRTMGVPLVRGRAFTGEDGPDAPRVVIINQLLASRLFPGQEAVGQRIVFTFAPDQPAREIVGVVGDENMASLDAAATPVIYLPDTQSSSRYSALVVRMLPGIAGVAASVRAEIQAEDRDIVLTSVSTMEQRIDGSSWVFLRRYPTMVVGVFAVVALLLALVGVYGVISYSISQRTREIGIRMALGARSGDVLAMVVRQGAVVALIGVGFGLAGALVLGQVMQRLLFGISASDPLVLAGGAVLILGMAVLASYLPARRAASVDPSVTLR
jgi:putative ABC transport system permease protein